MNKTESEVNVNSLWVRGMYYHIFSHTAESIRSVSVDWISGACTTYSHMGCLVPMLMSPFAQVGKDATNEFVGVVCIGMCVYLSRCDSPSMKQGQQAAQGCGADGSSSTARMPHQVGKQDVTQELL